MTEIKGNGTNGKRLWIRTPEGEWAPVPYGAGENDSIRSLNLWDGQKWVVPAWAWQLLKREPGLPAERREGLSVRAPGRNWNENGTHVYNPTYLYPKVNSQIRPEHTGYIRLFHTLPKNDPNWRIVSCLEQLPTKVPNTTTAMLDFRAEYYGTPYPDKFDTLLFFPFAGICYEHLDDISPSGNGIAYGLLSGAGAYGGSGSLAEAQDLHSESKVDEFSTQVYMTKQSLLIDLKAIRQRLEKDYAQRDMYFSGQYTPIQQMTLRRVVFLLAVQAQLLTEQDYNPPPPFDGAATVYVETSAPSTAGEDSHDPGLGWNLPESYRVRHPTSTAPSGDPLVTVPLQGGEMTQYATQVWGNSYRRRVVPDALYQRFTIENPGTDNLRLSCQITGGHQAGGDVTLASRSMRIYMIECALHYAVPGTDVPVVLRESSAYV